MSALDKPRYKVIFLILGVLLTYSAILFLSLRTRIERLPFEAINSETEEFSIFRAPFFFEKREENLKHTEIAIDKCHYSKRSQPYNLIFLQGFSLIVVLFCGALAFLLLIM